ncbi:hypothetical protein D7D25_06515 [Proteiniphilum sp. X52]|nr:hypothetical protein D7D25_06515 [Proteiniphilum sp. X52]
MTELKDWLLENGVTHVVMESSCVYWKPVYHVLKPPGLNRKSVEDLVAEIGLEMDVFPKEKHLSSPVKYPRRMTRVRVKKSGRPPREQTGKGDPDPGRMDAFTHQGDVLPCVATAWQPGGERNGPLWRWRTPSSNRHTISSGTGYFTMNWGKNT